MMPQTYLQQFQLALSTLDHLELLWEPPITPTEACSIYLHSFPHDMVITFSNLLPADIHPPDLTLDDITNRMDQVLCIKPRRRPHHAANYSGLPRLIQGRDPRDYISDDRKPLLPIGPQTHNGRSPEPLYLGGLPAYLESSCTNPATFIPDLSDSNNDGTVQAYLYWTGLPPSDQPPALLMHRHFTRFLTNKLHLLNQEEANLQEWHNRVLGCPDHNRKCTLDWVSRQFLLTPPDPNMTSDSLTVQGQAHFNLLLTWAYSVWMAQYEYYSQRWAYARAKQAPTWWLDFSVNSVDDRWNQFPTYQEPVTIPTIAWTAWIAWSESRNPLSSRLSPQSNNTPVNPDTLEHAFLSHMEQPTPNPPSMPNNHVLPVQPAFTAAYQLLGCPFADWLTTHRHENISTQRPDTTPFTFTIPDTNPPFTLSGDLPTIGFATSSDFICRVAIAFNDAISCIYPSHLPPIPTNCLAYLWEKYVLLDPKAHAAFRAAYAFMTSPQRFTPPPHSSQPPSFLDIRAAFISLYWSDGSVLNIRDCLRSTLCAPPTLPRYLEIETYGHRYHLISTFSRILPGYFEPDLSPHDLATAFINAFPGHFCNALSTLQPHPRPDMSIHDLATFFINHKASSNPLSPSLTMHDPPSSTPQLIQASSFTRALTAQPWIDIDSFTGSFCDLARSITDPPDSDNDSLFSAH